MSFSGRLIRFGVVRFFYTLYSNTQLEPSLNGNTVLHYLARPPARRRRHQTTRGARSRRPRTEHVCTKVRCASSQPKTWNHRLEHPAAVSSAPPTGLPIILAVDHRSVQRWPPVFSFFPQAETFTGPGPWLDIFSFSQGWARSYEESTIGCPKFGPGSGSQIYYDN